MTACNRTNPFLTEWDTPYGIPPFDQIRTSDYIPALKAGIEQQNAEIDAIVSNPDAPTFENTIAPLELSGGIISKVAGVLYNVSETDRSDALDAVLDEAKQAELREINTRTAELTQKIGNNILAESNAFSEKFGFSVSSYPEKMTSTEDRELRRQYNEAYTMRGHNGNENDNSKLIFELLELRIRKANILGYDTPAAYTLSNKMAANPETVDSFLDGIMKAAVAKAKVELADMQEVMDRDIKAGKLPAGSKIEPWDWWYYAEKVRKEKYDLDENEVKQYFKAENVINGIFACAKTLYGVNAEKLEGVPSYNPECVTTWKLTNNDGSLIGILTTDFFPRASKRGGAWMNNIREQYVDAAGNEVRPIIVNVGNLAEYMSIDEVQTVFHEFGHALHGLLSKCTYPSVSGTAVTRDFVEMFSQFNENWAFQPELLAQYAKNDKGEVIPESLVAKINNALKFNQGFMTTELCAASMLDMKWHELKSLDGVDIDAFESKVAEEIGLIPEITFRYRSTYFNHIFGGSGYNAGYYGYLWAEVLDKDAFSIFEQSPNGVWDLELAAKFKQTFLEKGGSEEPMVLYKSFAGREPDSAAMLRGRGLID